ncbi:MAG: YbjN domain-containing protein [Rhizobiaceae bacterium]|nr:YbjN domain-containing protein [Rhizobiaceae bacterium]
MVFGDAELQRQFNPVDVIELVAANRDWAFERHCDDEIAMSVEGVFSEYAVTFAWLPDNEALHLGCAFDMTIPEHRRVEMLRLLARINEQLLIGHFDLWPTEGAIMFRHALLLSGGADPTSQQAERLLGSALETCERFYQAFHFVVWANKDADDALVCSLFETVGNA